MRGLVCVLVFLAVNNIQCHDWWGESPWWQQETGPGQNNPYNFGTNPAQHAGPPAIGWGQQNVPAASQYAGPPAIQSVPAASQYAGPPAIQTPGVSSQYAGPPAITSGQQTPPAPSPAVGTQHAGPPAIGGGQLPNFTYSG